jgi:hypothetical protein
VAFSHWLGLAQVHLGTNMIEQGHSCSSGRGVLFDFEIPLATASGDA